MSDSKPFNLWAMSCAHVSSDLKRGRESRADAIRQSEGAQGIGGFDWDIAVNMGDLSGTQGAPTDEEGREVVRQYSALSKHDRAQIYDIAGNHDRSDIGQEEGWWTDKWADPMGKNPALSGVDSAKRPYQIDPDGTWERYSFQAGNLLFLMLSDINEPTRQLSRDEGGGNPSGVVSGETFNWWKKKVEANQDKIIITSSHYMLKDTTVASGEYEGYWQDKEGEIRAPYHGYKPNGTPRGASYLYFVDGKEDAQAFEQYLAAHPPATALWLGGHTHANPDDTTGGKSHVETKWGTHFINVSALTRYHGGKTPMSRVLTFTPGSDQLQVRCYMHTDNHAPTPPKAGIRRPSAY